jgi:hypothetical protein
MTMPSLQLLHSGLPEIFCPIMRTAGNLVFQLTEGMYPLPLSHPTVGISYAIGKKT